MKKAHVITALALLLFAGAVGWTVWWFFLATYGQRVAMAAAQESTGPSFAFGEMERFGFPLTLGLRFRDVTTSQRIGDGALIATASVLSVTARPWAPRDIAVDLPEGLGYTVTGSNRFSGQAETGEGAARATPIPVVELRLRNVSARPPSAAPIVARHGMMTWSRPAAAPETPDAPDTVAVAFSDIAMAEDALFGPAARRVETDLLLHGQAPLSGDPDAFRRWRANDGKVEIRRAEVEWGALDLTAWGTLGLDNAYRLAGEVNLGVANGSEAIARLQDRGVLNDGAATAARAFLAISSLTNGGAGRATAPLLFGDGAVTVSGFPIGRLDPVCDCR